MYVMFELVYSYILLCLVFVLSTFVYISYHDTSVTECVSIKYWISILSLYLLCLRDNSVHVYECSPFWVGIFIIFNKKTAIV